MSDLLCTFIRISIPTHRSPDLHLHYVGSVINDYTIQYNYSIFKKSALNRR